MISFGITDLRKNISDIVGRVFYGGERIAIEKNGKPACVIISVEDLKLLEAIEDQIDIQAAREALQRNDFVPWETVKKELNL